MNYKLMLLYLFSFFYVFTENRLELIIKPTSHKKMDLLIGVVSNGTHNAENEKILELVAKLIKDDFDFGDQFNVEIKNFEELNNKNQITNLDKKFSLVIFLNKINATWFGKSGIEWRLYDTESAKMLQGKKVYLNDKNYKKVAHSIANQIWVELTGQESSFFSAIVACKKIPINNVKYYVHIYAMHPIEILNDSSKPFNIIEEPTICFSPRWHNEKPLLYYSKHTPFNVRLMSIDLNKKKSIVSDFDGLNMSPAFMNKKIVLSLTRNGKGRIFQYDFDENEKKGKFFPLTDEKNHAISPSFIDSDNLLLCLINKSKVPRIAIFNIDKKTIDYLTKSNEYCVSPSYCKKNNSIAYCKKINGFVQIFIYDLQSKKHKQLTSNSGDKDSCSWSPCGNYIVFSSEYRNQSRIAVINVFNQKIKFVTAKDEYWNNPAWSPVYEELPFIQ